MLYSVVPSFHTKLSGSGDRKGVVQGIAASIESVKAWNMNGVLINASESEWYVDPLKPLSVLCSTTLPILQECHEYFIENNNEGTHSSD